MMTRVAVLDDWQGVARSSADWSPLKARAEVVFFEEAFDDEDDAAAKLADFEIVLSMRERTPLPASLIDRLPKLRMLGITGARNLSLDVAACTARGVVVCNTTGASAQRGRHRGIGARPADGGGAGDSGGRRQYPRGPFSGGLAGRHQSGGKDDRDHRPRPSRIAHGTLLPGAEHERAGLEPEPDRGEGAAAGATLGLEGRIAVALRRGQHPSGAVTPLARADRRR